MVQPQTGPEDILPTYDRVGPAWAAHRTQVLFERGWLARMLAVAPGPRVLDLGCGAGRPIATWLLAQGAAVTGVDGAVSMCRLFGDALPNAACHHADMRRLSLRQKFDAILSWDAFFHLSAEHQRGMFEVFAAHAAPGAALMFTSGPRAGNAVGAVAGAPVFHASLDPADYRALFAAAGFEELAFSPEDAECDRHTIWLARYVGPPTVA